ncbi:MAG: pyruvate, water dikinase [Deltaproteobacteria bacterium]|nr:pyruvate, water dikinase [Deltaproteobacteria bacterium]
MSRIADFVRNLAPRRRNADTEGVEALRNDFRARYHRFKLLLNANNKALEIMAEMEEALKGRQPFGMTFVMSQCTSVSTSVWQIIKNLNELAPGPYEELYERFKEIQKQINPFVQRKDTSAKGPLVIPLKEVDKEKTDLVGAKIANLGEIRKHVYPKVPNGFVVTATGYERFMRHSDLQTEIDRKIQATDTDRLDKLYALSAEIQQMIIRSPLPEDLQSAIAESYRALEEQEGKGFTLAMRSSALGEDYIGASFAGQYRTELNVSGEHIFQAYKEIVSSKYGLAAMTYRLNRGIRDEDIAMCVGCMTMVDALSSGVMYSRNPVDIRDERIVINAVWGLPKTVVNGSSATDLFVISRGDHMEIVHRDIPVKEQKFVCYPQEGVCRLEMTEEDGQKASITDDQARDLALLAVRLEEYYGGPQDMEWAIRPDGPIMLLQCRPLRQTAGPLQQDPVTENKSRDVIFHDGVTASPGVAAGPVYIVKRDMDALQFPKGAILVTTQSLPRWATLLGRAAGVVTEQGGVAGHLANVARELGVPALFGVREATNLLEHDQPVTLDADGRKVYRGRVEELLERRESPKRLMIGSPVYEALKGASQLIIPLNFLDPDAPSFKPKHCRTFHDVTRFCHEKSVQEMFQFGKKHRFPERSSKQLLCEVPMQWWILNLDDGFKDEVSGRYVRLENIASIPMLAIWRGITAFPWEGPPAVDGKGFMSVMFEATKNTALVPGVRSSYGNRNYFMISRHYCSLSSRLGFHFSTVEALVGDRPGENYLNFHYKGGAADFERRLKRVLFLKDILEQYEFRVEIRKDALLARVEAREETFMEERLRILGYLTIHTRQLDMIMANRNSVQQYRWKIDKDIHAILQARAS